MENQYHILMIEDEDGLRDLLSDYLQSCGYLVSQAKDGEKAMALLEKQGFHLIISDLELPRVDGFKIAAYVQENLPHIPIIFITGLASVDSAVEAMRLGAFDFQEKPISLERLGITVRQALEKSSLSHSLDYLKHEQPYIYDLDGIIAQSQVMKRVVQQATRVATTDATVLLTGESGTGKSLIAGAIHANSVRRGQTLVTVNCAALTETLLESELFGHEKGAFTGAHKSRAGRFQQAHGGTLFLDEVGDMALSTQAKVLHAIEDKVIRRVGGPREVNVDVRIISATNRDLAPAIDEGAFRRDLFYRLNVARIEIPPLRQRREDILPLAEKFMRNLAVDIKRPPLPFGPGAVEALGAYDWPGNIRELRNVVERALLFGNGPEVAPEDLGIAPACASQEPTLDPKTLNLEELERSAIVAALEQSGWVQSKAAKLLGITPRALVYKLDKHAISHPKLDARRRKR